MGEPIVPLSIDINNLRELKLERTVYNLIKIKCFRWLLCQSSNDKMMNLYLIKMAFIVDCILVDLVGLALISSGFILYK
jgi:hypothetical protein